MSDAITADYLVVGAGAMGMAFADIVLKETDARCVLVDRLDKPGGHWNHAYPFVRLHQPSSFYGVNSRALGSGRTDLTGRNKGLRELASVGEILDYFDSVLRHDLLPSGRLSYFPQTEHLGEGRIRSRVTGEERRISARKLVDASFMQVKVPQTEPPGFEVADDARCAPPGALAALDRVHSAFVVIGAGKTAFDAILYLFDLGVAPERITWIVPRDSWQFNRANFQPGAVLNGFFPHLAAIAASTSMEDMFARLEENGSLLRVDQSRRPTMFRCATISLAELQDLRRVENVVRLGRVTRLSPGRVALEQGTIEVPEDALFVNCSADGLEKRPTRPIFDGDRIILQAVRGCQQVFSAAFIAHVEGLDRSEEEKNAILPPDPHPDTELDYLRIVASWVGGEMKWASDSEIFQWLAASRLSGLSHEFAELMLGRGPISAEAAVQTAQTAMAKIEAYLSEA